MFHILTKVFNTLKHANEKTMKKPSCQQRFGASGGSVLRMTVFRKFELSASMKGSGKSPRLRQAANR